MKAIQLFIVSVIAFISSSCIVPVYRNRGGQQPYQTLQFREIGQQVQVQHSLKPFYPGQKPSGKVVVGQKQVQTGTKKTSKFIGGFTVQLWNSEDMVLKERARSVTEKYFRENGHTFPSDEYVSERIGHKCRLINKR